MKPLRSSCAVVLTAVALSCSGSSDPGAGPAEAGGPPTGAFPPVTDFSADGPFAAQTLTGTGPNGNYNVYLPASPPPNGARSPIVGWMSGGGTTPPLYPLLPRLATHGFVVVASNTTPNIGQEEALGQEILAGIDWAIAENTRQESPLFGRLDTEKLASMGYSMGSLATFTIANDPRLTTTVHISGGNMVEDRIANLRAPAAFFCGTTGDATCTLTSATCDIAAANCDRDFTNATTPVFYGKFEGGHLGILAAPNQDLITAAVTAWLRWKLMEDKTLASTFIGGDCSLCTNPGWTVQKKNLE